MTKNTFKILRCEYCNTFKVFVLPFLNIMNEWVKVHQSKLLTSNFYIHKEYFDDVNLPICLQDVQGD